MTAQDPIPRARASVRAVTGLVAATAVAVLFAVLTPPENLSAPGMRMAGIFLVALILWATEAVPIAVTALVVVILQPILGVAELRPAITNFMSPVFFFVVAMFCIAEVIVSTGLARRFALSLLARAGTDARRVVLAFMVGTAAISTFISDVPCCAVFMAIALELLAKTGVTPGTSRFAKALMIGIPIASLIGGVGTPAGSSVNILGLDFIEKHGHVRVPFVSWMAIGLPMVAVLVPVAWWVIVRCQPPEIQTIGNADDIRRDRARLGAMQWLEKKVIAIVTVMMALWIASSWVKSLDVTLIAVAGAIVMFLPGVGLLTWKQAERSMGWDALMMIGGVTSLGAACDKTGLAKWIVDATLGGMHNWNIVWIVAAICTLTVVIHLPVPIAPVVNAVLIPPIVLLAVAMGHNPALFALPVAFTASCAFLLPLDAVSLITYAKGHYRMLDMFVPGAIISVFWIVLMTALIVALGPRLGFY